MRLLLGTLLLQPNQPVSLDRLQWVLWGEKPPPTALSSLHNHAAAARRCLGAQLATRLRASAPGYLLEIRDGELDSQAFADHVRCAQSAQRREDWPSAAAEADAALALWQGPPFADLPSLADSAEAAQLMEWRLRALECRFDAALQAGRHQELLAELTALTIEHPLHEAFHAQLMLALHGCGRTAEAFDVHQALSKRLTEELGIDPGRLARDAYQALLSTDQRGLGPSGLGGGVPAQLPRLTTGLVGRERDSERVITALRPPRDTTPPGHAPTVPVVVVSGMGGVGKTALAVHAAHTLREDFPDGQLYADLNGFGASTAREPYVLLGRFLTDLGIGGHSLPDHLDDRAALYRATLARRRVLVVLDNARDNAQIIPLIPGTGPSGVIVTSRRALSGRLDCVHIPLQPLGRESLDLLAAICGEHRVAAEPDAAQRIVTACGGLPLALRLVGARIANRPTWPLKVLADRLAGPARRLELLSADDTSVRSVFAMSYQALLDSGRPAEGNAARAFRHLGLWPGHPLSLEAAAALLNTPLDVTVDLLDILIDAQILQSPAPNTYQFHDLVASYASEIASAEEPVETRAAAIGRLITWYAAAVDRAGSLCRPGESGSDSKLRPAPAPLPNLASAQDALAWLRQEMPAVRDVVRRAGECGLPQLAFAMALMLYDVGSSYWWGSQWEAVAADALALARAHEDEGAQSTLHYLLAASHGQGGRYNECLTHLHAAEELHSAGENRRGIAAVLGFKALLLAETGRIDEAFSAGHRSIELFQEGRRHNDTVAVDGLVLEVTGNTGAEAAVPHHVPGELPLDDHITPIAEALINLGDNLRVLGQRQKALEALGQALTTAACGRTPWPIRCSWAALPPPTTVKSNPATAGAGRLACFGTPQRAKCLACSEPGQ
ncbi:AfsR/SARP family transcriptional regulator [Kitasatospora cinereorecta]|uniref:BTAD domain-containing putative transcriptional regulator n=1 Tax=Kitasatospora cinereorecta TaxID=285560 RepID=A0ABW0VEM3_9ACTN